MSKIDIRDGQKIVGIRGVVFADADRNEYRATQVHFNGECVLIQDCDDAVSEISLKDIDNLILALKKAKELWGMSDA